MANELKEQLSNEKRSTNWYIAIVVGITVVYITIAMCSMFL